MVKIEMCVCVCVCVHGTDPKTALGRLLRAGIKCNITDSPQCVDISS